MTETTRRVRALPVPDACPQCRAKHLDECMDCGKCPANRLRGSDGRR